MHPLYRNSFGRLPGRSVSPSLSFQRENVAGNPRRVKPLGGGCKKEQALSGRSGPFPECSGQFEEPYGVVKVFLNRNNFRHHP